MVCLHAADPATVYLSAWARVDGLSAAAVAARHAVPVSTADDTCCGPATDAGTVLRPEQAAGYVAVLKALADPHRLRMLSLIAGQPAGEPLCVRSAIGPSRPSRFRGVWRGGSQEREPLEEPPRSRMVRIVGWTAAAALLFRSKWPRRPEPPAGPRPASPGRSATAGASPWPAPTPGSSTPSGGRPASTGSWTRSTIASPPIRC